MVALVQAVVGVSDEDIAADYSLTARYCNESTAAHVVRNIPEHLGLRGCPPELILETLDRVRKAGGSVEDHLIQPGVTAEELDAVRAGLVGD